MATFQTEYEDTTTTIDNVVTSQLSSVLSWANVPGSLIKVVSSSAGYAWGYNGSNQIYICQLPCSGNWIPIDVSLYNISLVHDLVADLNNVYILVTTVSGKTQLLIAPASNQGTWNTVEVPFSATTVFSTHSFIWAQDSTNAKQRCPKPCTMSNWIPSKDVSVQITSSSDTALYGKDASGTPLKSDETLQTGWQPISALGTKVESVFGQMDQSALYGIDSSLKLFRFDGKETTPVDTAGYTPLNVSLDPSSKQLWMTSVTPGDKGNIFGRVDTPDYSAIMNTINPLDRKRDEVVKDVETAYDTQTNVMTVNKQVSDVVEYFKRIFHVDRTTGKKGVAQAGHIQEQIRKTQQELDQINAVQPLLQKFLILLAIVSVIYMLGSVLGSMVHMLALVVLGGGLFYIVNNPSS